MGNAEKLGSLANSQIKFCAAGGMDVIGLMKGKTSHGHVAGGLILFTLSHIFVIYIISVTKHTSQVHLVVNSMDVACTDMVLQPFPL